VLILEVPLAIAHNAYAVVILVLLIQRMARWIRQGVNVDTIPTRGGIINMLWQRIVGLQENPNRFAPTLPRFC
jgi:hypothetical protein